MIIFFESGRLGNQLFQYVAMRKFQPQGPILAIGMSDLKMGFDGIDLVGATRFGQFLERIARRVGERRIANAACRSRLLTLVEEVKAPDGVSFRVTPGIVRRLVYFKPGYYQSGMIVEHESFSKISVKAAFLEKARQDLNSLTSNPRDRFFIHVRRGDYIRWPSPDAPAVLTLSWYQAQMDRIRKEYPCAFFVILSDDPPYVNEFFSRYPDVAIIHQEPILDFAVITQCHGGGILSASSFAWWGAYFIKGENPHALLIAPKYWAGHRSGKWFPPRIQTSWLTYAET